LSFSDCLPAGTYHFWAGPSTWGNFPCEQTYYATLTCEDCVPPPAPPNDNCEDVVPAFLGMGQTLSITGTSLGATPECPALGWTAEVWEAFYTTEPMDVSIDFCGTTPAFATIGIVLDATCPCDGAWIFDTNYEFSTCGDGNGTIYWLALPAGTYYYPIYVDGVTKGPYTMQIKSIVPVPDCDAGASVCDEYIAGVAVADLNSATGCGLGDNGVPGYSNYRATVVNPPGDYAITVLNGPSIYTGDNVDVWLDFNNDLFWTDAGGYFALVSDGTGAVYTGTLTIPPGTASSFVMRIRMDYFGTHNPCGITTYGEVEDYTVVTGNPIVLGDVNCDGFVNAFDIDPFVLCLVSGTPTPPCTDCLAADINGDTFVNAFDIDPFVACIIGGGCP